MISSATRPWAARCTVAAASLLGASTKQKTLPVPSSYQLLQVFDAILLLDLEILLMGTRDRVTRQALHVMVDVHIQGHTLLTPFLSWRRAEAQRALRLTREAERVAEGSVPGR